MEGEQTQLRGQDAFEGQTNQTVQVQVHQTIHGQDLDINELMAAVYETTDDWAIVRDVVDVANMLRDIMRPAERDIRQRLTRIIATLGDEAGIDSVHGVPLSELLRRVKAMNDDEVIKWLDEILNRVHGIYTILLRAVRGEDKIAYWLVPVYVRHVITPWFLCELSGHRADTPCIDDGNVECDCEVEGVDVDSFFDDIDVED